METATAAPAALDGDLQKPPIPPAGRRRRRLAALGAIALALAAAVVAVLRAGGGPAPAHRTGVPPGQTTARIVRRTLSESTTVDGTLGYGSTQTVYDRLSGTYTWLPAVGVVITRGGTLFRLDELPVVLMYGAVPAYRALKRGSEGRDVAQLNANLAALGYDSSGAISEPAMYGAGTEASVRRWQKAEGLPVTGEVQLGRVVFATGPRRVTSLDVSLGQDPPAAEDPAAPTTTAPATTPTSTTPTPTTPAPAKQPAHKTPAHKSPAHKSPAHKSPAHKSPQRSSAPKASPAKSTPKAASSEAESAPKSPTSNGSEPAAGGGEAVMTATPTGQVVTVQLKAEEQTLARLGERAPVTLPNGREVTGRIVSSGTVATEAKEGEKGPASEKGSGEGEGATIPVTLALERPVAHLDKAPVSVELVKNVRHDVLCAPVTALTATAGGGYAVQTLRDGRVVAVAVTPGMFAGGYVEVEGPGVHAGMPVLEPR